MAHDQPVPEVDLRTTELLELIGRTVRASRRGRCWPQRRLAVASGCSQSEIARIERAALPNLTIRRAVRVLRALGIDPQLELLAPRLVEPRLRDAAHARCVGAVARRLARAGFLVATEVEVGSGRWRGFIDILAIHPEGRLLLVIEVKTEVLDLGAVDRQLGAYVEAAWAAARSRGWRPRGATGLLLLLATDEVDRMLGEHRPLMDAAFPLRSRDLRPLVESSPRGRPPRGARGLAMIDPATRRRGWLLLTRLDGRRTAAPYRDRVEFVGRRVA
jgi:transcriptional regulator with XRE-family HTH domain